MEVFLNSSLSLDEVARNVANALNPRVWEHRYGLNIGGGDHYQFIWNDLELHLVPNAGETFVSEMKCRRFFIRIFDADTEARSTAANEIADMLETVGLKPEVADTGA